MTGVRLREHGFEVVEGLSKLSANIPVHHVPVRIGRPLSSAEQPGWRGDGCANPNWSCQVQGLTAW